MAFSNEREPSRPAGSDQFRVVVATPEQASSRAMVVELEACPEIEVVSEVHDAVAATEAAVMRQPNFTLLDVFLPDLDDACRWITKHADAVRLVLLRSGGAARRSTSSGGIGSPGVPEPCSLEEFLASVQALRDGGAALDPFAARIALATVRRTARLAAQTRPRLTGREWEVLQLRAGGTTLSEVARQLYVSENTVRRHFLRIREKVLDEATD